MFDLSDSTPIRDFGALRDIEIRALTEVIECTEKLLRRIERDGNVIAASRAGMYALVIQAVLASARAAGYHGQGNLVYAPLLDAILDGADADPWDTAIFAVLVHDVVVEFER
ncbi:hypothetical protein ACWIGI_27290 [Nocardia sp. NPDC055321]